MVESYGVQNLFQLMLNPKVLSQKDGYRFVKSILKERIYKVDKLCALISELDFEMSFENEKNGEN